MAFDPVPSIQPIRFAGDFELDLRAFELRRKGKSLKLERIPMELLTLLVERRGEVVTREQIVERIWGKGVFLDTDNSIRAAVRKVRQAFKDDPESPRFVVTVMGKGYRFIAQPTIPVRDAWISNNCVLVQLRVMLAVLPFENLSRDPDQEYFSDGLTEETISHLGRINPERIGVIARTSSMAYKRTTKSIRRIGAELGVDFALESSVRREGNRIRVTSQLIRVADQTHVWASTYDREGSGFLAIQDELGRAIAQEVQVRLASNVSALLRLRQQNAEAHDCYLRGRYYWNTRTGEGFRKAVEYFRLATERDAEYAHAYAGLADAYLLMSGYSVVPRMETIAQARAAVGKALELDDSLAEPHASLGLIAVSYDYDWAGAEREYQEAIRLNPNYATAHQWYGQYLALVERFDEALMEMQRAQTLDPVSPVISTNTGEVHYLARRYDEAIEHFRKALDICPAYFRAETWLARAYGQKKMFKEALANLWNPRRLDDTPYAISLAGYVHALSGERQEAQAVLIELEELSKRQYVDPALIAIVHLELQDRDQAFAWLEKAFLNHSPRLTSLKVSPEYDPLRSDPRFLKLARRIGLS